MARTPGNRFPYSPLLAFISNRPQTVGGATYQQGDPFDKASVSEKKLRQLWDLRRIECLAPVAVDVLAEEQAKAEAAEAERLAAEEAARLEAEAAAAAAGEGDGDGEQSEPAADETEDETEDDTEDDTADETPPEDEIVPPKFHKEHRGQGNWYVVDSFTKDDKAGPFKKAEIDAELAKANEA